MEYTKRKTIAAVTRHGGVGLVYGAEDVIYEVEHGQIVKGVDDPESPTGTLYIPPHAVMSAIATHTTETANKPYPCEDEGGDGCRQIFTASGTTEVIQGMNVLDSGYSGEIHLPAITVILNGVKYENVPFYQQSYGDYNFSEYPFLLANFDTNWELYVPEAGTYEVKVLGCQEPDGALFEGNAQVNYNASANPPFSNAFNIPSWEAVAVGDALDVYVDDNLLDTYHMDYTLPDGSISSKDSYNDPDSLSYSSSVNLFTLSSTNMGSETRIVHLKITKSE